MASLLLSKGGLEIKLDWELDSQSGYTSTIRYAVSLTNTGSSTIKPSSKTVPFSFTVELGDKETLLGGTKYTVAGYSYSSFPEFKLAPGQTVTQYGNAAKSGTVNFTRDSETNLLSLTARITTRGYIYYEYADGSSSADFYMDGYDKNTWTVESITAFGTGADITAVSDFTDETNPIVTYKYGNMGGTDSTTIELGISLDNGASVAIEYRPVPPAEEDTYTFDLTGSERQKLWSQLVGGTTGSARFYIRTTETIGVETKVLTKYFPKTFKFVNYTPVIANLSVVDNNSDTLALTSDENTLVRYMSTAYINIEAVPRKGATIAQREVRNGPNRFYSPDSSILSISNVTSNTFYFTVTDNRGYSTNDAVVFNNLGDLKWVDYVKPTCSIASREMTSEGVLQVTIKGLFFGKTFGDNENAATNKLTVDYLCNIQNEEGEWESLGVVEPTINTDNDTYQYSFKIPNLSYTASYQLTVRVSDELASSESGMTVVTAETLFDWSKNDFRFNIPVQMDKGYMYPQTLLWQGAAQMGDNESITLDKPVTEQPTGIVLVFSLYRDNVEDASIHSFFLSRVELDYLLEGKPHMFMMGINPNLSVFGSKYLYIYNDRIVGWVDNTKSDTAACGITFDNSKFVLRYVIGV